MADPKATNMRILAAFDFLSHLIGRDWVTIWEIADAMGRSYRTAFRYAQAAEAAGLVEYRPGRGCIPRDTQRPDERGAVRLVSARLRRAA